MTRTEFENLKPGDMLVNQFGEKCTVVEPCNKRKRVGMILTGRVAATYLVAKNPEFYTFAPSENFADSGNGDGLPSDQN